MKYTTHLPIADICVQICKSSTYKKRYKADTIPFNEITHAYTFPDKTLLPLENVILNAVLRRKL